MNKEEENKQSWINEMIKELDTEEKLREELGVYYGYMQNLQKLIYELSGGILSKPNYHYKVYMEFLDKYKNKKAYDIIKEKISYVRIQFEDEDILDEYCCELKKELKDAFCEVENDAKAELSEVEK